MTTDPRTDLVNAFREILDVDLARTPEQIFVNVPVGRLADAALEMLAAVPAVPAFDPEVTPKQRFHSALVRDDVDRGETFGSVWVTPAEDDTDNVVFHGSDGKSYQLTAITLPAGDAEQYLLAGLATVYRQREANER